MKIRNNGGVLGPKSNTSTTAASGVWSVQEIYQNQRDGSWPIAVDPSGDINYNQTTLLLHGDGTNGAQNNTFLDGSPNAFTVTRNGNTTQGTFTPFSQPDGSWSNYFPGASALQISNNAAFNFGSGAFTVEAWVFLTSSADNQALVTNYLNSSDGFVIQTYSNKWNVNLSGDAFDIVGTTPLAIGSWTHVAISGSAGSIKLFINGTQEGSTYTGSVSLDTTAVLTIGNLYYAGTWYNPLSGYISNLRLVKGTALYTSNFTPPTTPLTAVSGTSLLTCQSNRFKDNSTNGFTITVGTGNNITGSPSVQLFSPFGGTTAYSAATNGGSVYFDGSGDYFSLPSGSSWLFTGDHCLEAWVYWTTSQASIIYATGNAGSADQFGLFPPSEGIWWGQTSQSSSVLPTLNAWNHVCVTRQGTTIRRFLNGKLITTATVSGNIGSNSATPYIGIRPSGGSTFTGNISNLRIINGSVPTDYQTSSTTADAQIFTPSTAPFTTTSQGATSGDVKLLLLGTNAGIIDNTGTNNLETVSNISISTTQKKFGTASMYFDASSSYLKCPSNPNVAFGTGDFTIEYWMYSNDVSSSTQKGIFQTSDTAGGLKTSYTTGIVMGQGYSGGNLSGAIRAIINNTEIGSSVAVLTTGVWYHIALVRVSGVVTIYVNGNSVASGTVSSSIDGTNLAVGGYYNTSYTFNGYIDDFRITKGIARYLYNFTPPTKTFPDYGTLPSPPSNDPYFGSTSLLLHGDGSSGTQNQTFLDSSTNAFTITRNGNATQGTFTPFSRAEGYWSNFFGGPLTVPAGSAFAPGTGDFTVEMWIFADSLQNKVVYSQAVSGTNYFVFSLDSAGPVALTMTSSGGGTPIYGGGNYQAGQWTHIAAVRQSGTVTVYVNGKGGPATTNTLNLTNTSYVPTIGDYTHGSYPFTGNISNFRYVKGTAVYTSNFTPSTTPLTAISGTSWLTCQSNRFKDNSTNAYAVSAGSSTIVQPLSPFEPTTAYSAATNGGSAYFDGSGDYLSSSVSAIGTGDFTVEFFANLSSTSGGYFQISTTSGGLSTTYTNGLLAYSNSGTLWFFVGNSPYATTYAIKTGEWVHIALVRSSGTVKVYVNGVLSSTPVTDTTNISGTYVALPGYYSTSYLGTGYISNFRVLVGTALYTSNFTPPTAPLAAITNTSLLLSATNAGIIDNTASNNLETVGTAQASAVQYKYGTGAMYFPGSSYLNMPASPNFVMKRDYTLECWIYNTGSTGTIFDQWIAATSGQGNYQFYIDGSYKFNFYYDGLSVITHPTVMSTNTWYHLAAVRLGSTIRTYVNGLSGPTASSSAVLGRSDYTLWIGAQHQGGPSNYFTGYVDDARMTNGVCRYPYNFTIPTTAYPDY